MTPVQAIEAFAALRVLVIGEAMLDRYLGGNVRRVCREAPVPIVALGQEQAAPGGAANTAMSVAALGAQCQFLSATGRDRTGEWIAGALKAGGVDTGQLLPVPGRTSMTKTRVTADGQLLMRLDEGSEESLDELHERRLIESLTESWDAVDAVIASDYGYGICTPAVIAAIAALQRRSPRVLVVDAKDLGRWRDSGMTAAKPNYAEAITLIGAEATEGAARLDQVIAARDNLSQTVQAKVLAFTLDRHGTVIFEDGREPYRTFTAAAPGNHAAGAGDTFTAALALALAAGASVPQSADLAAAAAAVVVERRGTTRCTAAELLASIAGQVKTPDFALEEQVAEWRRAGRRIVFTNGCFDILHHGHIAYLNRAKAMGDILIVGLNSDASVRRLKGETRPINPQTDRAAVLAALSSVDLVLGFDEDTPERLIGRIRPDLFVKGGDYTLDNLPERAQVEALGGEVKILPFLDDRSTTSIIARITDAAIRGQGQVQA